jgi:hypothetical protein
MFRNGSSNNMQLLLRQLFGKMQNIKMAAA